LIIATREAKMQGKIGGIDGIEPIDNPYDFNKKTIIGFDNKKDQFHKLQKRKRKEKHADKEIQKYIEDGWEVTSYLNSVPT
jgi:hypothetical protein